MTTLVVRLTYCPARTEDVLFQYVERDETLLGRIARTAAIFGAEAAEVLP